MHVQRLIIGCFLLLLPAFSWGQDTVILRESKTFPASNSTARKSAASLLQSLEENLPDDQLAARYTALARDLVAAGDYVGAETRFRSALTLYERLKDNANVSATYREIGRVQELQNRLDDAAQSYNQAARAAPNRTQWDLNRNDVSRLQSRSEPVKQTVYIQSNLDMIMADEAAEIALPEEEIAVGFSQMAQAKRAMKDTQGEIEVLEQSVSAVSDNPVVVMQASQELAEAYAAADQYEKAAEVTKEIVEKAKITNNPREEVRQLQNLSSNYFQAEKPEEGIASLREAYDVAMSSGQTFDAQRSLQLLAERYRAEGRNDEAMTLYADFVGRLEGLLRNDSTLLDDQVFQLLDQRITQLETERELKDELIARTNRFNYVLLGSVALILLFLLLIARTLYAIKRKNKRIALQSLRREMNPHFIFNSLNSVNQFIAQNNELEANKYLSSYSKLMRNMMETSNKDFISLSTELEQLREYLELEHMRFNDKFSYEIKVDSNLDPDSLLIPNMLIQPQLENAVWHGLRYREVGGRLTVTVEPCEKYICVIIEDNGIGRQKSAELKTKHQREHNSRGLNNTRERIDLLNSLYHTDITLSITDKEGDETGVIVVLRFPVEHKTKQHER